MRLIFYSSIRTEFCAYCLCKLRTSNCSHTYQSIALCALVTFSHEFEAMLQLCRQGNNNGSKLFGKSHIIHRNLRMKGAQKGGVV